MCDCSYYPIQLRNDKYQLKNRLLETHTHIYIAPLSVYLFLWYLSTWNLYLSPSGCVCVCVYHSLQIKDTLYIFNNIRICTSGKIYRTARRNRSTVIVGNVKSLLTDIFSMQKKINKDNWSGQHHQLTRCNWNLSIIQIILHQDTFLLLYSQGKNHEVILHSQHKSVLNIF